MLAVQRILALELQPTVALHLAMRATHRLAFSRTIDPSLAIGDLLSDMQARAAVLADVVAAAPPTTRAFHVQVMTSVYLGKDVV